MYVYIYIYIYIYWCFLSPVSFLNDKIFLCGTSSIFIFNRCYLQKCLIILKIDNKVIYNNNKLVKNIMGISSII